MNCHNVLLKRLQRLEEKLIIIFKPSKQRVTTCKDYIIGREITTILDRSELSRSFIEASTEIGRKIKYLQAKQRTCPKMQGKANNHPMILKMASDTYNCSFHFCWVANKIKYSLQVYYARSNGYWFGVYSNQWFIKDCIWITL